MGKETSIPFKERQKLTNVNFFGKDWFFNKKNKPEKICNLPENFDEVIPNLIYRGSWPLDVNRLTENGISRIITLYSSYDKSEVEDLKKLQKQINKTNIEHHIFDTINNQKYWQAAELALNTDQKTYIHCRGGSIRTGIVSFLTELLYIKKMKQPSDNKVFIDLINKTIEHGYNYANSSYKLLFEDIIKESCNKKLLPRSIF